MSRKDTAPRRSQREALSLIYLVLGDADLLVRQEVDDIVGRALEGGLAAFNRAEGSLEERALPGLLGQARTPPMMGPRRVVVVRGIDKARPEDLDALLEYAKNPNPTTVLVIVGRKTPAAVEGVDRGRRLQNAVSRRGQVKRFKTASQDPVGLVVQRVESAGSSIRRGDAAFLVEVVGRDLGTLASEVDKLIAYAGPEGRLTSKVIGEVCCQLAEAVVWDLTDAIVRRNARQALAITHRLLEDGEAPQRILALVAWKLRQLLVLQQCLNQGLNPYEAGVKMPSSKMKEARTVLRKHALRTDHILNMLAQASLDMHGHRAGDRRVLEGLVLGLVAGSR